MKIVEVKRLNKRYPNFRLQDVSFTMEAGRTVGFVGRNGAGKTTTIKSMLGLVHPDGGEVCYFGLPFRGHEAEIKERIGYSTGAVNFYPKKKLKDLVAQTRPFYANWDEDAYRYYLDFFGLDENKAPSEMSEGMKVKCNLLTALSHRSELLILDEPTSGLDPFSRSELLDALNALKEKGVAIFFSTHIISDLEKSADDLLFIRNGSIAAAMPIENFKRDFSLAGETLEDTVLRMERGENRA